MAHQSTMPVLDEAVGASQAAMRKLQHSIRSSIALSKRRSDWGPSSYFEAAESFAETLEWRNTDIGHDLGTHRTAAAAELVEQLREHVEPYGVYFQAYLNVAEHINTASGDRWRSGNRSRVKLNVLCELHAQSLTIAEEVLVLIRNGYSTGAAARWRTLYEIATIAKFISRSPKRVAERYRGSHIVEQHLRIRRGDTDYLVESEEYRDLENERRRAISQEFSRLVARYGPSYGYPYGWAAEQLGLKRATFADIDSRFGDADRRLSYVTASQHIHGVRLSSIMTMTRRPESESVFAQGEQDPYRVQVETVWTLHDLTWELASLIARTQDEPEALYWAHSSYMFALDADTEALRGRVRIHPAYLRARMSIEPSSRTAAPKRRSRDSPA